jgi:sugar O-acyltransferase (sialic acid O-acetyltransferase NeuD family)
MADRLIIYGLGETALLAHEYFTHDSQYEVAGFTVDAAYKDRDELNGLPVLDFETVTENFPPQDFRMFVASASGKLNRVRTVMFQKAKAQGYTCPSYISSRAFVWRDAQIGENCFILEDNTIQPFTKIGNNVVMWSGNHFGHRSVIEDNCFITSHVVISGFCTIGTNSFVGVNACFADNVTIARDNFIAMGAVVHKSTEADSVYMGNPAQKRDISALRFCKVDS